jgi:HAD superfamily hydrolase (TIGR01509 family)
MIILIPLGGIGERFKSYSDLPKALIPVDNKPIIFHLIDNLNITNNIERVVIPYNKEYFKYNFEELLTDRYPHIQFIFIMLQNNTEGAADTIRIALTHISNQINECPILCIDSDNFYTTDIIQLWDGENAVFTFMDRLPTPRYSYITPSHTSDIILNIIEKEKISDIACCGSYGFQSWKQLLHYANRIIENKTTQKNEYYTSTVIAEMITHNIVFKYKMIQNKFYYSLGTPDQVNEYKYPLLFDLDGTLVNTDNIYTDVWNYIFKHYNLGFTINDQFFNHFIKGKADATFLQYLLPNIDTKLLNEISELKDTMFIKLLSDNNNDILLPGVKEFFEKNKNRKIGIVTNCNSKSAKYIINYTGLDEYISILITANDCTHHKPHPEPYLNAISLLHIDATKTIIFEDSYSGYISAMNSNVYKVILICNQLSDPDIQNAKEYKIANYINVHLQDMITNVNPSKVISACNINIIYDELIKTMPITEIIHNSVKLKTGYICDIQSYNIKFNDNRIEPIVLKVNNTENELANTANKMNLYNNEINFYKNISNNCNIINIPKCYGIVNIDETQNINGIILENLLKYPGTFNINLNCDARVLFIVISEISKLHIQYYFKSQDKLPLNMMSVTNMKELTFFKELLQERFDIFIDKNRLALHSVEIALLHKCMQTYDINVTNASSYPLSFCHGDFKSANIFYKENSIPYLLDWQYIQLNKGVSDICFLLVESINYDKIKVELVLNYYYCVISEKITNYTREEFMQDFKTSLMIFPFVVCVWFNSEDSDKLLDKVFPIKFMKNLLKYYVAYLHD